MQLMTISLERLCVSPANMRGGTKPPDYAAILPSVRARGVLVPLSKSGSRIDHVCGWVSWKSEKVGG